jgi:hypothetical protein
VPTSKDRDGAEISHHIVRKPINGGIDNMRDPAAIAKRVSIGKCAGQFAAAFKTYLRPLREIDWVVYAKEPFAGPRQVRSLMRRAPESAGVHPDTARNKIYISFSCPLEGAMSTACCCSTLPAWSASLQAGPGWHRLQK